jgi:hypothetical protein
MMMTEGLNGPPEVLSNSVNVSYLMVMVRVFYLLSALWLPVSQTTEYGHGPAKTKTKKRTAFCHFHQN